MSRMNTWVSVESAKPEQSRPTEPTIAKKFAQLWQDFLTNWLRSAQLQVWCDHDREGNVQWSAYDPATNRGIDQLSEAEMRIWIERRYP